MLGPTLVRHSVTLIIGVLVALGTAASGQRAQPSPAVGDRYTIIQTYRTASRQGESSSGSSSGRSEWEERVVALRTDGVEFDFDLPSSATSEDRAREWQFPARILRSTDGTLRLLNAPQLEARLAAWLKRARLNRSACGRSYFTWSLFTVECDVDAVVETVRQLDLRSVELSEGALHVEPQGGSSAPLTRNTDGSFMATISIDARAVARERAKTDVQIGAITNHPVEPGAALATRLRQQVSGIIRVTFVAGADGRAVKRTRQISIRTVAQDAAPEEIESTETLERRFHGSATFDSARVPDSVRPALR